MDNNLTGIIYTVSDNLDKTKYMCKNICKYLWKSKTLEPEYFGEMIENINRIYDIIEYCQMLLGDTL